MSSAIGSTCFGSDTSKFVALLYSYYVDSWERISYLETCEILIHYCSWKLSIRYWTCKQLEPSYMWKTKRSIWQANREGKKESSNRTRWANKTSKANEIKIKASKNKPILKGCLQLLLLLFPLFLVTVGGYFGLTFDVSVIFSRKRGLENCNCMQIPLFLWLHYFEHCIGVGKIVKGRMALKKHVFCIFG